MSFNWNVQPYAWKKELVNEYASAVMLASRARAVQYAAEAQAWMRENAPWTDRTEQERARQIALGRLASSSVPARKALRVTVDMSEEKQYAKEREELKSGIIAEHERSYRAAVRQAEQDYRTSSVVPYESALERLLGKVDAGTMTIEEARGLAQSRSNPKSVIVPQSVAKSVPKGRPNFSSLRDFDKEYRSRRMPIVSLKFSYGKNTPYNVWLEIANGGRYAIIGPAVEKYADKFFNDVQRIAQLKQFRDRIIFGEAQTAEQRYQAHVAREESEKGRPYQPWQSPRAERRSARRPEYDIAFERTLEEGVQVTPIGEHRARRSAKRRRGR